MALFLQLDVQEAFGLPFRTGSHLLAFMCPHHNEIPSVPADYESGALPEYFWDQDEGHYGLRLYSPEQELTPQAKDEYIAARRLAFAAADESVEEYAGIAAGSNAFKVGGQPGWINYAVDKQCPCGGRMAFVCQIPDSYGVPKTPNAPSQPDSFSDSEYCLFLGNQVVILACERQCDCRALIAVCDN